MIPQANNPNNCRTAVIGITCDLKDNPSDKGNIVFIKQDYLDAIFDNQGISILLPPCNLKNNIQLIDTFCDALLITGGAFDISSEMYGETPIEEMGKIIPERTDCEFVLLERAVKKKIPILGICGGQQLLNVFFGGTLYQDISTQCKAAINHDSKNFKFTHPVSIKSGTKLNKILKKEKVNVNTTHHQAVNKVASDFIISAVADDGIIEGIEKQGQEFIIGVQWHPEFIRKRDFVFNRIFSAFIKEAINCKKQKFSGRKN